MTVRIVIQCRMSSSRLPGKALLPINGIPIVILCAKRAATSGIPTVVAISEDVTDKILALELAKYNVSSVRGSLNNVLDRFVQATKDMPNDGLIVRLTADNVFPDGGFVLEMLDAYKRTKADYLGIQLPQSGLPYGLSAEIFSARVLRLSARKTYKPSDLEHVTPWISRECQAQIYRPRLNKDFSHLRATIDRFEDYIRVSQVFQLVDDPIKISWRALCKELDSQPDAPLFRVPWHEYRGRLHSDMTLGTVQLGMPYGIANHGGQPTADESRTILQRAVSHGILTFDCASAYGDAESILGDVIGPDHDGSVDVITKLDPMKTLESCHLSGAKAAATAKLSVFRSLHRLRRRKLDTLLLHRWGHRAAFDGNIWKALHRLKSEGLIRKMGASVSNPQEAIEALSDPTVEHIQLPLNLLDWRWRSSTFLEALRARPDVTIHARSAYLQGLLPAPADSWPKVKDFRPSHYVEILENIVERLGRRDRADLCIAYVRSHVWVRSIVVGVETRSQLDESMGYFLNPVLESEEREYVDRMLPKVPEEFLDPSQWLKRFGPG